MSITFYLTGDVSFPLLDDIVLRSVSGIWPSITKVLIGTDDHLSPAVRRTFGPFHPLKPIRIVPNELLRAKTADLHIHLSPHPFSTLHHLSFQELGKPLLYHQYTLQEEGVIHEETPF